MKKPDMTKYENKKRMEALLEIKNGGVHLHPVYGLFWKHYGYVQEFNGRAELTPAGEAFLDPRNHQNDYLTLPNKSKITLDDWITSHLRERKTINLGHTSYGLKHFFEESSVGFYITNGMFKGAMLNAGFYIYDQFELNWHFNVAEYSIKWLYKWLNRPVNSRPLRW